jgi:hypothetical protein
MKPFVDRWVCCLSLAAYVSLTACHPVADLATLNTALNTLLNNKSVAEETIRDFSRRYQPTDPDYVALMKSYERARDSYNRALDSTEQELRTGKRSRTLSADMERMQQATGDFFGFAADRFSPARQFSQRQLQNAVTIPEDISKSFRSLPAKSREQVLDSVDATSRWPLWADVAR